MAKLEKGLSLSPLSRYGLVQARERGNGMVELPRSSPEFEARLPDDAACARWLPAKRWPEGFRCPACGHDKAWELGRERRPTPQCAAGERQVSVTAGTGRCCTAATCRCGHGSCHLPLRAWFLPPAAAGMVPGGVADGHPC